MGQQGPHQAVPDYSEAFYRRYARRYAEVSLQALQATYRSASHPRLRGDWDLIARLKELAPGPWGLDAGCGAEARDVYHLAQEGYRIVGLDVVQENLETAIALHPPVRGRLLLADLKKPLPFVSHAFHFILCNAVIQHIAPEAVWRVVFPELSRVLKPGGVLQLMFKPGRGILSLYDPHYDVVRHFQLYEEEEVLACLHRLGFQVVPPEGEKLGGVMRFVDGKGAEHTVMFLRKSP